MNASATIAESQATNLSAAIAAAVTANERVTKHAVATLEATLDLGRALAIVKDGLEHGEFRPWLAANAIGKDRATRAMTIHRAGIQMSRIATFGGHASLPRRRGASRART